MILQISSKQISLGMRGDDVIRFQQALRALGRSISPTERGVLGADTEAVVKALQPGLSRPATGVVDAATVRGINLLLAKLATGEHVARGTVRNANDDPFSNRFVEIFSYGLTCEPAIGNPPQ